MQPVPVTELDGVTGGSGITLPNIPITVAVATVTAAIPQVNVNVLGDSVQTNTASLAALFALLHY